MKKYPAQVYPVSEFGGQFWYFRLELEQHFFAAVYQNKWQTKTRDFFLDYGFFNYRHVVHFYSF